MASLAGPVPAGAESGARARLTVRVEADNVAARVVLDGRERGEAPLTVGVAPGDHAVELRWAGGVSRANVSLRDGDHHVMVVTTEPIGTLGTIVVPVAGVAVAVDGTARGQGPLAVPVQPGEHVVRLSWPDGRAVTRSVSVRAGDRLKLRVR